MSRSHARSRLAFRASVAVALVAVVWLYRTAAERQRIGVCENNLRQIGLGIAGYANAHDGHLPTGAKDDRLGWLPIMSPYMDMSGGPEFRADRPWNSWENLHPEYFVESVSVGPADRLPMPSFVTCPSGPIVREGDEGVGPAYVGITGIGADAPTLPITSPRAGVFGYDRPTWLDDLRDGLSQTMMVAESAPGPGIWTGGGRNTLRHLEPGRPPYLGVGGQFGGNHRRGAWVLHADGSVGFVANDVDPRVFEAMATINGGDGRVGGEISRRSRR